MRTSKFIKCIRLVLALTMIALPAHGYGLPEGETVVSGSATFDRSQPDTLNVQVATDRMIANYNSFSIGSQEAVHFIQPSSSSVALNRVVGVDPSVILGALTANGRIFLINPSGIVFGQGSRVDVAGMIASTLDLSDQDFLAGRYSFIGSGGSVINQGYISSPGGYVALLGSTAANAGVIEANLGSIVLASGKAMTLSLDPKGAINVVIDEASLEQAGGADSAVLNSGRITADGGKVILTAKTLGNVFDKAVNNEGIIEAKSCVDSQGQVFLLSEGENELSSNTGIIDVSAKDFYADGGFIEISGDKVDIGGIIDASSTLGNPGELLIDPWDITIVDKKPSDGLSGSTVGEMWLEDQNYSITIQADNDVIFDLTSDNVLNLVKFNDETFTIKAGRDIVLNDDSIRTNGGNIKLYSDYGCSHDGVGEINLGIGSGLSTKGGNVLLEGAKVTASAPITTGGGDVTIRSKNGDVVHTAKGDVETTGGDFYGESARDYILRNDASIDTGRGDLEINAEQNIVLGSGSNELSGSFDWKYIKDERSYRLLEFGYYYNNGAGLVYVPLSQGTDIGKDHTSVTSGSGVLGADVSSFNLYAIFKPSCGSNLTWYEDQALNADGKDHVTESGIRYGWEDLYNLGDRDFNDAVIDVTKNFSTYGPGAFLSSHNLVSLDAEHGSITQSGGKITVGNSCTSSPGVPVVVSSTPGKETWTNDNTVDVSWKIDQTSDSGQFIANAGNKFTMQNAAEIDTNNGDAKIVAEKNVALTLIDAGTGAVDVSSKQGSIIDNDKGKVSGSGAYPLQNDYDILAGNIKLSATHGSVGGSGAGDEIDLGYSYQNKGYGFSYVWTTSKNSQPDVMKDSFTAQLGADGDWIFTTVSGPLADGDSWYFHVAGANNDKKTATAHYGAFYIDTTAPVISAGGPAGTAGNNGWYLSDVIVPFSATDNLSGFAPSGSKSIDLASETTTGEGTGLTVTSDGVYDRAGNFAAGIDAGPFKVDKTAPVISAGDPAGTEGNNGWYLSDVTVPFSAKDNLSGFNSDGDLTTDLDPQTTIGEGKSLIVTSDGVYDQAGNFAAGIDAGPFKVDKTAPVISAGDPIGTLGGGGSYESDVTVPFSATDNLSGFEPDGELATDMDAKTTTGEGSGLIVTSDGIYDMAGNFAAGINAGPFTVIRPELIEASAMMPLNDNMKNRRVYYEILKDFRFVSVEPATPLTLYRYHPLTPTNMKAFDDIALDANAYKFIDDNIKPNESLSPYFGK